MIGNKRKLGFGVVFVLSLNSVISGCGKQPSSSVNLVAGSNDANINIRVGVDAILPAFESTIGSNELQGFDIDLINSLTDQAGLKVEFVNNAYRQIISMVAKCQLDAAISAIAISILQQQMNFSDAYYTTSNVLVVKKGNIAITNLDNLAGVLVGTQAGSPSESEAQKIPGIQLKSYPSFGLAFLDMLSGYYSSSNLGQTTCTGICKL